MTTKRDKLNAIIDLLGDNEELVEFCKAEIALLDKKAEKAKEAAAKKKAAGDELSDLVESLLTDEYQSIGEITEQIGDEAITARKVGYRLSKLENAEKDEIIVNGKRVIGYRRKSID